MKNREKGYSLIETMLVVVVGAVVVGLVGAGLGNMGRQNDIDNTRQSIILLKNNIQSYYQGANGYAGLDLANIQRLGLAKNTPLKFEALGGTSTVNRTPSVVLHHPYGGDVTVAQDQTAMPPTFSLTFTDVPPKPCVALVTAVAGDPTLALVTVGGKEYVQQNAAGSATNRFEDAPDACSKTQATTITYTFH